MCDYGWEICWSCGEMANKIEGATWARNDNGIFCYSRMSRVSTESWAANGDEKYRDFRIAEKTRPTGPTAKKRQPGDHEAARSRCDWDATIIITIIIIPRKSKDLWQTGRCLSCHGITESGYEEALTKFPLFNNDSCTSISRQLNWQSTNCKSSIHISDLIGCKVIQLWPMMAAQWQQLKLVI